MKKTISFERNEEIATMALHKLMEIDPDAGQRFMIEEIDMDKEEVDHYGVARVRTVTEIEWDTDDFSGNELPTEVIVPWDVFDDDIADWLSDEYGYCVSGYLMEDEDE